MKSQTPVDSGTPRPLDLRHWLSWQIVGLLVVIAGSSWLLAGRALWRSLYAHRVQLGAQAAAYVAAVIVLTVLLARRRELRVPTVSGVTAAALAVSFLAILVSRTGYGRPALVAGAALTLFFVLIPLFTARLPVVLARASMLAGLAGGVLGVATLLARAGGVQRGGPAPSAAVRGPAAALLITANELSLEARIYPDVTGQQSGAASGGGIAALREGILASTNTGRLHFVTFDATGAPTARALPIPPPGFGDFDTGQPPRPESRFRVTDLEVFESRGQTFILVANEFWDGENRCMTVRLVSLDVSDWPNPGGDGRWRELHRFRPCVTIDGEVESGRLVETGGRILQLDDDHVLLTVGNPTHPELAQDGSVDVGRTLRVEVRSGRIEEFTRGHRNAQGLALGADGRIWLTEHGPKGGDELNLLVEGGNYGWPIDSEGVDYLTGVRPRYEGLAGHEPLTDPVYAWVPSIGISNLVELHSDAFSEWRGDLLIGSLRDRALWRVRVRDGRIRVAEPLRLGRKVRDLVERPDGRLYAWTDGGDLVVISRRTLDSADALLAGCLSCHTWGPDDPPATAPPLQGVYGREVGSVPGFDYSPAMRAQSGRWTDRLLDAYLRDPSGTIPGTSMVFDGIADSLSRVLVMRRLRETS